MRPAHWASLAPAPNSQVFVHWCADSRRRAHAKVHILANLCQFASGNFRNWPDLHGMGPQGSLTRTPLRKGIKSFGQFNMNLAPLQYVTRYALPKTAYIADVVSVGGAMERAKQEL